jgi:membrane associated rhomboid family serine protease
MLLPYRHKNPPESFPFVTCALILINVAVFAATSNGWMIHEDFVKQYALSYNNATPLRFLTSMFLHADTLHLLGNMWFLYLFGFAVEGRLKTLKFIGLYFVAGICGDLLHLAISGAAAPDIPSLGASGAIMGLLGAALYLFPHSLVSFFYTWGWGMHYEWGVTNWRMYWVAAYYVGIDVLFAFLGDSGVAHFAHIGGVIGGVLMCIVFMAKRDTEQASDAKAMLSEMKDVTYLSERELDSIAENSPNDPHVAIAWMHKSLTSGQPINANCIEMFRRLFPKIVSEGRVEELERAALPLSMTQGVITCKQAISLAFRLEKDYKYSSASQLLLSVMNDPGAKDSDIETAIFRWALISENNLLNRDAAARAYEDFIKRFPMSPMASQANTRLKAIRATLPESAH